MNSDRVAEQRVRRFWKMLLRREYTAPEPLDGLAEELTEAKCFYDFARDVGAPEECLELLRTYMLDVTELLRCEQAPSPESQSGPIQLPDGVTWIIRSVSVQPSATLSPVVVSSGSYEVELVKPWPVLVDEDDEANSEGAMIERYARALFETDARVVEHVGLVADCESPAGFAVQDWGDEGVRIGERWERAMQIAWARGAIAGTPEATWRRKAEDRAVRFYDRLIGRP